MKVKTGSYSLYSIGIMLFLMAMYSIGTLSSIRATLVYSILLLVMSVLTGFLVNTKKLDVIVHNITPVVFSWITITTICLFSSIYGERNITSLLFYLISALILILFSSVTEGTLYNVLSVIKRIGVFFAVGCYWQMAFREQYMNVLFPLFATQYHDSIRRQFFYHHMSTGFTSQTAVAMEFIALGLMAAVYLYSHQVNKRNQLFLLFEIFFLIGGILLTGKRSPILTLGTAFIIVDMITTKRGKVVTRMTAMILVLFLIILGLYYIAPFVSESRNTIIRLINSLDAENIEELSNGRLYLYSMALLDFEKSPLIGIGWESFRARYGYTGVHNIYLQLLCETGIIGFPIVFAMMAFALIKTIKMLKVVIAGSNQKLVALLKCSTFIQIFIWVYGLLGNPLYDNNYLLMYVFGLLISSSAWFSIYVNRKPNNSNLCSNL